jgi:hypothetical protein
MSVGFSVEMYGNVRGFLCFRSWRDELARLALRLM